MPGPLVFGSSRPVAQVAQLTLAPAVVLRARPSFLWGDRAPGPALPSYGVTVPLGPPFLPMG